MREKKEGNLQQKKKRFFDRLFTHSTFAEIFLTNKLRFKTTINNITGK